ncbi:hypothetical protein [Mesorhizobium sp. SP-1A]|uniref:hypothetical protein n=1 Tax=Mesorhizobium sp. SP-1A TaxID=3077840 RepID=UPI0028F7242D|nr:hypothetical protein [Mesorhizobium sp. SP-1A]
MGMHKFPLSYSVKGKMPGTRKEESKRAFEIAHLHVREVSEIDTSIIGAVKLGDHTETIRFFEGKFWIKDAYTSEDGMNLRRIGNLSRQDALEEGASTFRDRFCHNSTAQFKSGEAIDESTLGFKSVTENGKTDSENGLKNLVQDNIIEIDGELYVQVPEPIYEIHASKEPEYPKAWVQVNFLKYEDTYHGRYSLYDYDFSFRFAFDKRDELDLMIEHLRNDHNMEPAFISDGEHYFGGEFTTINDDRKNLLNAGKVLVENKRYWEDWPVAQLTAWGNLRDAYRNATAVKKEETPEDTLDALAEALKAYDGLQGKDGVLCLSTHARAAVYKWETREIDLSQSLDLIEPNTQPSI